MSRICNMFFLWNGDFCFVYLYGCVNSGYLIVFDLYVKFFGLLLEFGGGDVMDFSVKWCVCVIYGMC